MGFNSGFKGLMETEFFVVRTFALQIVLNGMDYVRTARDVYVQISANLPLRILYSVFAEEHLLHMFYWHQKCWSNHLLILKQVCLVLLDENIPTVYKHYNNHQTITKIQKKDKEIMSNEEKGKVQILAFHKAGIADSV